MALFCICVGIIFLLYGMTGAETYLIYIASSYIIIVDRFGPALWSLNMNLMAGSWKKYLHSSLDYTLALTESCLHTINHLLIL